MYQDHSYGKLHPNILTIRSEEWEEIVKMDLSDRPAYEIKQNELRFGQIVSLYLGTPFDIDEYYNRLYDYVHDHTFGFAQFDHTNLDRTIDQKDFQSLQKLILMSREEKLSINRFVAFLDGENLLIRDKNPAINRRIREAMIETLRLFEQTEDHGLQSANLRRVLVDVIKWAKNHFPLLLDSSNPEKMVARVLWYGDANESQVYFLYYMYMMGFDLAIFNPAGIDPLAKLKKIITYSFIFTYPDQSEGDPFPKEKRRRQATVAYRASREIEAILNHEGSYLYKPWQLRDYTPSTLTLKTTYDELFILIKEKAFVRPNFEVKNGHVNIPSIFAKIMGVSRDRKEYWDRIQFLLQLPHAQLIQQFPFTRPINNDFRFHYQDAIGTDGLLSPEKMMRAHYWKYKHLPTGLQKGIAYAIRTLCSRPSLLPVHGESNEEVNIYMFTQSMQIPSALLQLLQTFDYSQDVPTLILYNNELNGQLSRSDAVMLLLLNQFGIDIVLYNPPGHNDLENYMDPGVFDTHWLDDMVFNLEFKEPSIIKKIFSQGFLKNLRGD
ncbi:MAG TPA: YceG family protein [Bacillus sp. (in: firmicutes)]|uniref:YceG family protein n=1 Tax=Bacillus litorisediminis TaxID=2922713 RepID=UPI001FADF986|nr:YceG family protein [Bacillus litorisediminis]HWO76308.1 YceG family protein [Bacillus sp. (in: firmicutes)]